MYLHRHRLRGKGASQESFHTLKVSCSPFRNQQRSVNRKETSCQTGLQKQLTATTTKSTIWPWPSRETRIKSSRNLIKTPLLLAVTWFKVRMSLFVLVKQVLPRSRWLPLCRIIVGTAHVQTCHLGIKGRLIKEGNGISFRVSRR